MRSYKFLVLIVTALLAEIEARFGPARREWVAVELEYPAGRS